MIYVNFIFKTTVCFPLGYRYGNTLVTMSEDDKANMKYKAEKCLKVLGFTKMEHVSGFFINLHLLLLGGRCSPAHSICDSSSESISLACGVRPR